MDILIKNMEMPKDCYDCKFLLANYDESECQVTCYFCFLKKETICEGDDRELAKGIKPSTCPLVALPEHELISVHKVLDYLAERAETSKEMGDDDTASLFASMGGDILAIVEANNGSDN